jgi:nicotinate phosphoribosyltransferase
VPALDCAYKLQEYAGTPRRKRSEGKATWPGRKQVYRRYDAEDCCCGDTLTLEDDAAEGLPLIQPVMRQGRRLQPSPPLTRVRAYTRQQLERLPLALRSLEPAADYPVEVAPALRTLADRADRLSGMP